MENPKIISFLEIPEKKTSINSCVDYYPLRRTKESFGICSYKLTFTLLVRF